VISSLAAIAWLIMPPLSALAAAMLWYRTKVWGLIPIAATLVLVTFFFVKINFSDISYPVDASEEERRIQSQLFYQLIFAALFAVGSAGIIWQCGCEIWRKKRR
jgi:magnesium-transporting ATPase (P-type)